MFMWVTLMKRFSWQNYFVVLLLLCPAVVMISRASGQDQQPGDIAAVEGEPFVLDLPRWDPDPELLPEELRPLEVVRPTLPDAVAAEIASVQARIAEIESTWMTQEMGEQDAVLNEAIRLAERVLALRETHQGNTGGMVRWRDASGRPETWHRVVDAGSQVEVLCRIRGLDLEGRARLVSLDNQQTEFLAVYRSGNYRDAVIMARAMHEQYVELLGEDSGPAVSFLGNLAVSLKNSGNHRAAEELYRESLELRVRTKGSAHPDTLTILDNIGVMLVGQGRFEEARPLLGRSLLERRRVLGDEHTRTVYSLANVGSLLRRRGQLRAAEPFYLQALEVSRRAYGDDHLITLRAARNQAELLEEMGAWNNALAWQREVLRGSVAILGELHPDTAASYSGLAGTLFVLGELVEAAEHEERALDTLLRIHGPEHPMTLISLSNIGRNHQALGRIEEAMGAYTRVLGVRRRTSGMNHPDSMAVLHNLGMLHLEAGSLASAERILAECLSLRREILGDEHPDTLVSLGSLENVLRILGRYEEAEEYAREIVLVSERVRGVDHPNTHLARIRLAQSLRMRGLETPAEELYRTALEGLREQLGEEHPRAILALNGYATMQHQLGRYDEAVRMYRECDRLLVGRSGVDAPGRLQYKTNIGGSYFMSGKTEEAEVAFRKALEGYRDLPDGSDSNILRGLQNLAGCLVLLGHYEEARDLYVEALGLSEELRSSRSLGSAADRAYLDREVRLSKIARRLAVVHVALGEHARAADALERGFSRAGLDLLLGGRGRADTVLRSGADESVVRAYEDALHDEENARLHMVQAEARMERAEPPAREEARALTEARREFRTATRTVFSHLRDVMPAAQPMSVERISASLPERHAILMFSWTGDASVCIVIGRGGARGFPIARSARQANELSSLCGDVRSTLGSRPSGVGSDGRVELERLAELVRADDLIDDFSGLEALYVIPDGPFIGIPMERVLKGVRIAYAPSATIAVRQMQAEIDLGRDPEGAVVLGAPRFEPGGAEPAPAPENGLVVSVVQPGLGASTAGIREGDVIIGYADRPISTVDELRRARDAAGSAGSDDGGRPETAGVDLWREGEVIRVLLAPGPLGVRVDPRSPSEALRSIRFFDSGLEGVQAEASALEQARFHGAGLSSLPGTLLEAQAVASMLGGEAVLLVDVDATVPKLRDEVEATPPRVLHLATHGLMGNQRNPLHASLAFTRPERPTISDTGFLTLEDLLDTWVGLLRGTELVVLSACDTGRGEQVGDTTMTLPLGFFVCGAESVIASLWPVDDTATALLMARFYANWLGKAQAERRVDGSTYAPGESMSKLTSLREAKAWLETLHRDEVRAFLAGAEDAVRVATRGSTIDFGNDDTDPEFPYEHPYFWSGFVLYGAAE